jgi:hypothetical protein
MRSPGFTASRPSPPIRRSTLGSVRGHESARSAEHQGLAQESLVEHDGSVDGGDARFVAAVLDAAVHAAQQALGVHQARRQRLVPVGRGEAEDVGVEDGPAALAGAQDVAVDADNSCHGAAVGVQRRRAVVGLGLDRDEVVVVEAEHARVVGEHRDEVGPLGHELHGGGAHAGLEQRLDLAGGAVFVVHDAGVEDLVLAVLAPGLGDHFQFDVGGVGRQADGPAEHVDVVLREIFLDGAHFFQRERQGAFAGHLHQFFIGIRQGDRFDPGLVAALHCA